LKIHPRKKKIYKQKHYFKMEINGKPIKYSSIVPLIGGMTIANKQLLEEDPAFFLSYPAFASNDAHAVNYFQQTPYIVIDPESNLLPEDNPVFDDVDFVSAVCPCAGLSMLNSNNGASTKARGSDAEQNEWMYKSARIILEQVRPKVFWGENAPGLYTNMGFGVVEKLKKIGEDSGYSMSLIKTDTYLHGIPQHRIRTFYFFWRDSEAPLLNYYKRESPHLKEYLAQIPADATFMDKGFGLGKTDDNPWVQFLKYKNYSMQDAIAHPAKTILGVIWGNGWVDDAIEWGEKNSRDVHRLMSRAKEKFADSKGVWDASPILPKESTNAIIAKNSGLIHPDGERGITVREAMHLMGLPHDFQLIGGHWNHICQNVPVSTAKDWTTEVVRFLKGEITEYGGSFVKQNNISQKIDYSENAIKSKVLF